MNATHDMARLLVQAIASDPEILAEFADALAPHLQRTDAESDRWMDTRAAAAYLGLSSANALHKLTATRQIPFEQDTPGGKCWFRKLKAGRLEGEKTLRSASIRAQRGLIRRPTSKRGRPFRQSCGW